MTSPAQMQQAKKARTEEPEPAPAAEAAAAGAASSTAGAGAAAAGAGAAAGLAASNVEKVWAKGTGYGYNAHGPRGTSSGPIWDAKAAAAAQEAQDEQINSVLQSLAAALLQEFPSSSSEAEQPPAAGAGSSSSSSGARRQQAASLSPSQESCLAALQDSVLRPLLAREMSHVAFSELVTRQQYYKPLLSIVQAMCHPALEPLLAGNAAAEEQEAAAAAAAGSSSRAAGQRVVSIVGAVRGLQKGAAIVKKQLTKALEAPAPATSSRVNKEAGEPGYDAQGPGTTAAQALCARWLFVCIPMHAWSCRHQLSSTACLLMVCC